MIIGLSASTRPGRICPSFGNILFALFHFPKVKLWSKRSAGLIELFRAKRVRGEGRGVEFTLAKNPLTLRGRERMFACAAQINRSIISKGANATSLANPLYQECLIELLGGPRPRDPRLRPGVDAAV